MATESDNNFCNEENKLRNIQTLNEELNKLHQYCVDCDLNVFMTYKAAKPFLKWNSRSSISQFRSLFVLAVVIGLCALALNSGPVTKFVSLASRQLNIRVFSWLDWRQLNNMRCFIPNPMLEGVDVPGEITQEDCQTCSNVDLIPPVEDISMEEMCNEYLNNSLPLVLRNQDVYRYGQTTLDDIIEMYLEDEVLNLFTCCDFASNIKKVHKDHRLFLHKLQDGEFTQYYAHWQNCFTEASKLFRRVYNRPALLPSTVQLSPHNWLLLSSDYSDKEAIQVPIKANIIILVQISGYLDIMAEPKEVCQKDCKNLVVRLQPKSIMIAPTLLYDYKYSPGEDGTSITVGLEGDIDL